MVLQSGVCKGCEKEVETVGHLFFTCETYSKVWYECLKWWGLSSSLQGSCKSHFSQFGGLISGSKSQKEVWDIIWYAVVWAIWYGRNNQIFKGKNIEVGYLVEEVKLKTWLWITAKYNQFNYPISSWCMNPSGCMGMIKDG